MTKRKALQDRLTFPRVSSRFSRGLIIAGLAGLSLAASAGTYYRWVDDEGITHYTAAPPPGVQSEKVTSFNQRPSGSSWTPPQEEDSEAAAGEETTSEQAQAASLKDPERCAKAKKRAETLRTNSRIRIRADDGELHFLSPDEIQEELKKSEQVMEQTC